MNCPICLTELLAGERAGVPIDCCPSCGGLWLDEGELSELIRREARLALEEGSRHLEERRLSRPFDSLDAALPPLTHRVIDAIPTRHLREVGR